MTVALRVVGKERDSHFHHSFWVGGNQWKVTKILIIKLKEGIW